MPSPLIECFRRWFEYEKDSHRKVLASLDSVPEDQRFSPAYLKAVTIMGHVAVARQMWLYRFGIIQEAPTDIFPTGLSLSELADRIDRVQDLWSEYLARLDDTELVRVFEYQSLDAGRFRSTVQDILTQLFGHSWYHRGQVASLIKQAGGKPAVTDFVYWSRQPVA